MVGNRLVAPQNNDIGRDAESLQFFYTVLRRLALVLTRSFQIGDKGDVQIQSVLLADLASDLTDGFQKRLTLDVADSAADFGDDNIRVGFFADRVDEPLDFVGDVGDDLHGFSEILTSSFLCEHVGIHLARREVRELVQVFVNKSLIVP